MKYAVIRIKGNQFKVEEGKEYLIDKIDPKELKPEVLLVVDGKKAAVGNPVVAKATVKIKVLAEEEKGKKLHVKKFKAKSRYRRKIGFRPIFTRIKVEKIS